MAERLRPLKLFCRRKFSNPKKFEVGESFVEKEFAMEEGRGGKVYNFVKVSETEKVCHFSLLTFS